MVTSFKVTVPAAMMATFPIVLGGAMFIQIFKPLIEKAIKAIKQKIVEAFTGGNKGKAEKQRLQTKRRGKEKSLTNANSQGNSMKSKLELEEREFEEAYEAHLANELHDTW